ncbi:hypothetical protein ACIQC0_05515 [Pseudarthrobacter sp. NPDC092419]|uniref:aggregation-promoting factor C-terminal-like domain-containing protein n=1 Tax=Pseudarthrobacter sp. NPDC092419 TaxID=3364414 RepID=UPI0037FF28E9
MSEFQVEPRPKSGASSRADARAAKRSRRGTFPALGKRAAVLAASCALLVGVGAAGQATESMTRTSSTEATATQLSPNEQQAQLGLEKSELQAAAAETAAEQAAAAKTAAEKAAAAKTAAEKAAAAKAAAAKAAAEKAAAEKAAAAKAKAAKPAAVNDPAGAQAYAASQLASYGWAPDQMQCLKTLWTKESDWKTTATNPSSGAYGIVQSLPAEKMASAGADYVTNYRTQINWGLDYIQERYQSPCGALNFHYANNWY